MYWAKEAPAATTMALFRAPSRLPSRVFETALLVLSNLASGSAAAQELAVPVRVQADLLVKVAAYDKNLARRAPDRVRVLIVEKPGDGDSVRVASQLRSALNEIPAIAGLPHEDAVVDFSGAATLAATSRARHASIVYLGPGLGPEVDAIRIALEGEDLLTVAAVPEYVPHGIVLGFALRSGKPNLLLNLTQARKQKVALRPEAVRLMTVVE